MIDVKWEVDDGKIRPGFGIPIVGKTYSMVDKVAHSYVNQRMASYVNAKDKPVVKKSKVEEK